VFWVEVAGNASDRSEERPNERAGYESTTQSSELQGILCARSPDADAHWAHTTVPDDEAPRRDSTRDALVTCGRSGKTPDGKAH
jgi:hypothetical protein